MPNKIFRELFSGKYDSMIPANLLPAGWISDGLNVRKISAAGGWKARKGCSLHNTTVLQSGAAVKSLHWYENPKNEDEHFIAQCNSKLLISPQDPPTAAAGSAWTDLGVTVGTTPGFSCVVDEWWFFADGSGPPTAWGGNAPLPKGFIVFDDSASAEMDYTRVVRDGRDGTEATVLEAADDSFVIVSPVRLDGVTFDLGSSVNSNSVTLTVKAMRSGTWTAVSNASDGTASGGATLAQDGSVTWDGSTSDTLHTVANIQGFAYQFTWSGALSGSVTVKSVTLNAPDAADLVNQWDGAFKYPAGVRFYDQSAGEYVELLGKLTNESTSQYLDISEATTSDFLYIKTVEPVTGFGFGVVDSYENTGNGNVDLIEYWDGDDWADISTLTDTTKESSAGTASFAQSGQIWFDGASYTPVRRKLEGDNYAGYWYRISWDDAIGSDVRIYVAVYATLPESLPSYDGCVSFKGRMMLWGDPEFPNKLRFSSKASPFCFSGTDSGYTEPFGDAKPILAALNFYNELIVFKKDSIWLLEGEDRQTFGTLKIADTIGLASPKSAIVVETGYPTAHRDEPLSVALWQEVDGIYILDGRKPRKISEPVDRYFNPEYSECIGATSIRSLQAFADPNNNEYHLLIPASVELVYNYVTDEWYPPWERKIVVTTGLGFRGGDDRKHTYGGSAAGWIMRLENDTADKTTGNVDEPIEHSVKTRALSVEELGLGQEFTARRIWITLKAQSAGSITTKYFKDLASSGTTMATPAAISMVNTGYSVVTKHLTESVEQCSCIAYEFSLDTVDQEMELHQLMYELDGRGLIDQ